MSIYLIAYIILALLLLVWITKIPHTPTSLDPEPASVWDFPGWYFLIMILVIIGMIISAATN
jgi:uncharacterized integral membrane protein